MNNKHAAAAITIMLAVAEAIRELGSVPSGNLYARLINNMDLDSYSAILKTLEGAGLISVRNDLIRWTGPAFEVRS